MKNWKSENPKSSKKHTWTIFTTITWLLGIVILQNPSKTVIYQFSSSLWRQSKNPPSLRHHFFYVYISALKKPKSAKGKSPHFFPLPSFLCVFISFGRLTLPFMWDLFFPMYVATLILFSLQKYFAYLLWVYVPYWELFSSPNSLVKQ